MIHVERSALLPYSAHQMYCLVNDVEKYPEFLPWCNGTEILAESTHSMSAKLMITKGPIKQYLITNNILVPDASIEINLQEGPFKKLHGLWTFRQLNEKACKINLIMEFDYNSILMKATLGPLFNKAASSMVDIFSQRANYLYG